MGRAVTSTTEFIADFHIHSRFSIATSRTLCPSSLHAWGQRKGLTIVATGDFTHPQWAAQLQEELVPAEPGLYRLAPELAKEANEPVPLSCRSDVRFILTAEISNIYKKAGKTRKVHNLIIAGGMDAAARIRTKLDRIGNVRSDGRPILGLDSKELLRIVIEEGAGEAFLVPAHAWTPHFSVLGAFSSFASIEECYEELTPHIFAIETGLSSDPPMNWRVSSLDRFALISNSDAHSPEKLAREANLFDTDLSFTGITEALKKKDGRSFLGTLEFFPQQGKYHYNGHRACGVCLSPMETNQHNSLCPTCGRKVTLGVCHRVDDLADRKEGFTPKGALPFENIIPLKELLSAVMCVGAGSKRVGRAYDKLLAELGPELHILRTAPISDINQCGPDGLGTTIHNTRAGKVKIAPGYDGEFGSVAALPDNAST